MEPKDVSKVVLPTPAAPYEMAAGFLFKLLSSVYGTLWPAPDDAAQILDNDARRKRYEDEANARKFSSRLRRYLAGVKSIALISLLFWSCSSLPLTADERTNMVRQLTECRQENQFLREQIVECLEHVDKLEHCPDSTAHANFDVDRLRGLETPGVFSQSASCR